MFGDRLAPCCSWCGDGDTEIVPAATDAGDDVLHCRTCGADEILGEWADA